MSKNVAMNLVGAAPCPSDDGLMAIRPTTVIPFVALLASCGGPPASPPVSPVAGVPTIAPETPYPTPPPKLSGTRSPASVNVGAVVTVRADGRDGDGWFAGIRWTLDDPAMASFTGPDVGATVDLKVLAAGPIRIRATRGADEVKTLLAGVSVPPPGRRIDLSAYGIDQVGKIGSGSAPLSRTQVITTRAGWRAFAEAFPGVGRTPPPAKDLRQAPPPVDLERASMVVLYEGLANVTDIPPVLTRVEPASPGLVEVVWPRVEHLAGMAPAFATYIAIFEVAKLPEGTRLQVIRDLQRN